MKTIVVSVDVPRGVVELRKGPMLRYMVIRPAASHVVKSVYWARVDAGWAPSLTAPDVWRGRELRSFRHLYLHVVPS